MKGTYRGGELRRSISAVWADQIVPDLMANETAPLSPLLGDKSGLVAIDVGANKGFWAAAFMRAYPGRVERVHMIDPSPENYRELTRPRENMIFSEDEFSLVTAYPYAMSDAPGYATLHTNDDGSPLASLYPDANVGHEGALKGLAAFAGHRGSSRYN